MIKDFTTVTPLSEDGTIVNHAGFVMSDNIPVLEENYVKRMNANNGFSEKRLFRKIASVPYLAVLKATQDGYDLNSAKDLHRFLGENPDYLTVEKIRTGRSPNIIVR
jgi:hypothetical protein